MKKVQFSFLIVLIVIGLVACGQSNSDGAKGSNQKDQVLTIHHDLGEAKVKENPEKIVVFDFGMLDTLDKMGVQVTALPKDNIPTYLSKFEDSKYINVGSLKEPDFEKIAEIGPDLIIISGRQAELYDEFKKIGPTVYLALDTNNYIESFQSNVQTLGKIFGKENFISDELANIDKQIAKVKEEVTSLNKNALILLVNEGKISAYGAGSRFGLIHDVLGFTPVDPNIEVSTHGQSVSFEYVLEKNPDYLFVVDRTAVVGGETSAKEVIENDLIKNTKAFKEGHIVYLNPNYWYLSGGGLESVAEMVTEIENSIQ